MLWQTNWKTQDGDPGGIRVLQEAMFRVPWVGDRGPEQVTAVKIEGKD